jgi:hypothetical protein
MNPKAKWIWPIVAAAIIITAFFVLRKPTVIARNPEPRHVAATIPPAPKAALPPPMQPVYDLPPELEAYAWLGNVDILELGVMKGVHITKEQAVYLQLRYDVFLDKWRKLQASVAVAKTVDADEVIIFIPPHHEEAMKLSGQFEAEATAYLGAAEATELFNSCGDTLLGRNRNFGEQEEQMIVSKDTTSSPPTYVIRSKQAFTSNAFAGMKNVAGPAHVSSGDGSRLFVGGDMGYYRYLAVVFPQ